MASRMPGHAGHLRCTEWLVPHHSVHVHRVYCRIAVQENRKLPGFTERWHGQKCAWPCQSWKNTVFPGPKGSI